MQKLTVIMYHYVRELKYTRFPEIKALLKSEFQNQIEYLKKNYDFVSAEDCISHLNEGSSLPKNPCLLTFDDGYIDHFVNVFPILEEKKIQGCFFPPAKAILDNEVLDVNKIHFILASMDKKIKILIDDIYNILNQIRPNYGLKSNEYYYSKLAIGDRFDSSEVIFIKRLLQVELSEDVRKLVTDKLFKKYVTNDEKSFSKELYMDLDQLKCMVRNGMYVGSHGFDHYWLDKITPKEQEVEIKKSLRFLDSINAPTKNWIMCYPYGAYNEPLIKLIKKNRCALGLTTEVGISSLSRKNAYTIERYDTNDFPK